ncbi:MAG: tetratricopeptide repeat protein, partial [Bacteroidota bacterium]
MNSLFPVICLIVFFIPGYSQNYYSEFSRHFQSNDTLKSREVLENWEKASPKDAELYTCWFNYYFKTAKKDYLTITQDTPEGEAFEISDTTGKPVGYMVGQVYYDSLTLQKGLDKIDEGIALFPDRLDMRFGKTYAYGQVKYWDQFRDEIIKTVRYSGENNNEWTWTFNVKKEGGSEFFLKALQDYQVQIYNTGKNELLPYMREVAEEVLRLYPEHVESLTNLAITYLLEDE